MDAIFYDRKEVWPISLPNRVAVIDLPDKLVIEAPGLVDRHGAASIASAGLPRRVAGLPIELDESQALTAVAAWPGTRSDAFRALTVNSLVRSLPKAEATTTG